MRPALSAAARASVLAMMPGARNAIAAALRVEQAKAAIAAVALPEDLDAAFQEAGRRAAAMIFANVWSPRPTDVAEAYRSVFRDLAAGWRPGG